MDSPDRGRSSTANRPRRSPAPARHFRPSPSSSSGDSDDSLERIRRSQRKRDERKSGSPLPEGMEWLNTVAKPFDDLGKNVGRLFCAFPNPMLLVPPHVGNNGQEQEAMLNREANLSSAERASAQRESVSLAAELERMSAAKGRGRAKAPAELERFIDLRVILSNFRMESRLTEAEASMRACWHAWDGYDRPLPDALALRKSGAGSASSGPPGAAHAGSPASSASPGAPSPAAKATPPRTLRELYSYSPPSQLETLVQKANMTAEWILTLLLSEQAPADSITVDEIGPLLGLMHCFDREEGVQASGAAALALLAVDNAEISGLTPEDLAEEGAITVLLTAMKNHRAHCALQEQAGSVLLHMALRSPAVAQQFRQAGGQRAIAAAIKRHAQLQYFGLFLGEVIQQIMNRQGEEFDSRTDALALRLSQIEAVRAKAEVENLRSQLEREQNLHQRTKELLSDWSPRAQLGAGSGGGGGSGGGSGGRSPGLGTLSAAGSEGKGDSAKGAGAAGGAGAGSGEPAAEGRRQQQSPPTHIMGHRVIRL